MMLHNHPSSSSSSLYQQTLCDSPIVSSYDDTSSSSPADKPTLMSSPGSRIIAAPLPDLAKPTIFYNKSANNISNTSIDNFDGTEILKENYERKSRPYLSHTVAPGNIAAQPHHFLTSMQLSKHLHLSTASRSTSPTSHESSPSVSSCPPSKPQDANKQPPTVQPASASICHQRVSYTEDSLTVNLMKVPKAQQYSTAPPPTRSALMVQVPPMHDVWLDDDDDDDEYSDADDDENSTSTLSYTFAGLRKSKKNANRNSTSSTNNIRTHRRLSSHTDVLSHLASSNSNSNFNSNSNPNSNDAKKHGRLRHSLQISKALDGFSGQSSNVNNEGRGWKNLRFSWSAASSNNKAQQQQQQQQHGSSVGDENTLTTKASTSTAVSSLSSASSKALSVCLSSGDSTSARASVVSLASSIATSSTSSSPPAAFTNVTPSTKHNISAVVSTQTPQTPISVRRTSPNLSSSLNHNRPTSFLDITTYPSASSTSSLTLPCSNDVELSNSLKSASSIENPFGRLSLANGHSKSSSISSHHSKRPSRTSNRLFSFLNPRSPKASQSSNVSALFIPVSSSGSGSTTNDHKRMCISSPTNFIHTTHIDSAQLNLNQSSLHGLSDLVDKPELSNPNNSSNPTGTNSNSSDPAILNNNLVNNTVISPSSSNTIPSLASCTTTLTSPPSFQPDNASGLKNPSGLLPALELKGDDVNDWF